MALSDEQLLTLNKAAAVVSLAVCVGLFQLLPLLIIRRGDSVQFGRHGKLWIDHLLRAGGGVLLATTFLHLLPEVREGIEKLQESKDLPDNWNVQIPELVMCAGFFMMYGLEELVHKYLVGYQGHETPLKQNGSHRHGELPHHLADVDRHNGSGPGHVHMDPERPLRGILLVFAISIHQIFEGMAVGLEKDVKAMWTLLAAVSAHKFIVCICVGAEVMSGGATLTVQIVCLTVNAIASSVGVGLGMILTSPDGNTALDMASALLQGLATGTLLFVVFFEILSKSQEKGFVRITEFLATFLGFFIMFVFLIFIQD